MFTILQEYVSQFITLAPEELEALANVIQVRSYDKKVKLIDIGDKEEFFHFIVNGLARKYFYRGSEEIITQLAREGELISSSVSYFSGQPSSYIIETIEPSTFLSLHKDNIEALYGRYHRLQKLGRLVITELFLQKERWELDRIRYTSKDRFMKFMKENPDMFRRVPQKYLASYLNMKPETFSRLKHIVRSKIPEVPF